MTIGPIGCGSHSIGISKAGRVEDGPVSRLLHQCEAGRLALQAACLEGKREVRDHPRGAATRAREFGQVAISASAGRRVLLQVRFNSLDYVVLR